jgi:hypothetical protein
MPIDTLMMAVYESRKDPDGFLYIVYTEESTLGEEKDEKEEEEDEEKEKQSE